MQVSSSKLVFGTLCWLCRRAVTNIVTFVVKELTIYKKPTDSVASQVAKQYGLIQMGVRPPLVAYLRSTWAWREFAWTLAESKVESENQNTYLGKIWGVLTPLINSMVYVLIFGFLLGTRAGMDNVIGYIVVGTFIFGFFSSSVTAAGKSITNNVTLVRSLHFPRSVLPVSAVLTELLMMMPATLVMLAISQGSIIATAGLSALEPARWLLIVPAIVLLYVFSTGVGLILAKYGSRIPDILKLLPFMLRILMYASGVLFSIEHQLKELGFSMLQTVMEFQPVAVFLSVARQALLVEESSPVDLTMWLWALVWALLSFTVGFVVFWRDEARYGRD